MLFKKKKENRDEEFFYNFLKDLTPMEMLALTKAIAKIMKDFANMNIDVKSLQKDNDIREIS